VSVIRTGVGYSTPKRGIVGTWGNVDAKHLSAYLGEMCFRFNNRKAPYPFRGGIIKLIQTANLEYKVLGEDMEANSNPHARVLVGWIFATGLLSLVLTVVDVAGPQSAPPRKDIPTIAKAANGAIVSIITSDKDGKPLAQGTGFLVSTDGRIVTNYHVIEGASSAIVKLPDGAFYDVDGVVAFDKARDLAVIKAHGQSFHVLTLGNSDRVQVGEEIVAIGSPLSLESTVSSGIVSGIRTIETPNAAASQIQLPPGYEDAKPVKGPPATSYAKYLQITAPISPGSSGGPLFNMAGEVVGVTTLYLEGGENLNFAIPINDAKLLLSADSKVQDFASTQDEAPKTVSEILDWIETHLETTTSKSGGVNPDTYTSDFDLSFDGCQVTVTWHFRSASLLTDTVTTDGPLDLAGLRPEPEQMPLTPEADSGYQLRLYSLKPFVSVHSYPWQSPERNPNAHTFFLIFATQDMAERQQKAWRDAIVLCGGKAVPDKLY
jgi:S1-C subfamily serine protease